MKSGDQSELMLVFVYRLPCNGVFLIISFSGPSSAPSSAPPLKPDNVSKEEAEILRCQLEAYRNEVDLLKTEKVQYADEKETQIKALQHALLGMQQVKA